MPELFAPSHEEMVACVEREIRLRERVYPRWVAAGKMTDDKARREIETMRAVLAALRAFGA